ncbi:MAG TPA: siroheme synthase CysG [Candidatus Dormibacteraeota bacterium]|nr:siroheme synthase CysG [Candidatus Dormibacteraeota bacterium]
MGTSPDRMPSGPDPPAHQAGAGRPGAADAPPRYYPVYLDLRGRRCVVLGGGQPALDKTIGLLDTGAHVRVVAAEPVPALRSLASEGRIELVERPYREGDLAGAWLAVDASGDPGVNQRCRQEAEARRVLLNVLDVPDLCHFIAPAVVRRDPLQVAISTGGESPYLAAALRARLERQLGPEWGPFTSLVGTVRRRLRRSQAPAAHQQRVYRDLLASPLRRLLRDGKTAEAERQATLLACGQRQGRVALVGAGPGDPDLLTTTARELLAEADVVLHDALVDPRTLALCGPATRLEDVGKRPGQHRASQAAIVRRMIELAKEGQHVVRLKGGDPFVFGRGGEELAALTAAGVPVIVVPGVSAALAAPAAAGIPVTLRGVADSFAVVSGHGSDGRAGPANLEAIAAAVDTLVVLMPMAKLEPLVARLTSVLDRGRPAALIASASLAEQRVVRAPLAEISAAGAGLRPPVTLVVGPTAAPLDAVAAE